MIHYIKSFLFIILLSSTAYADSNKDFWQCKTRDNTNLVWTAKSNFQKTATNLAYSACKKESNAPASCRTSTESCEYFAQGISTRPLWRCTALDLTAAAWKSAYYNHRLDAAFGAKQYCQNNSKVPTTCYVNMVTCYNQNEDI
ncbi:MAG: hypothetical protein EPN84_12885 [Legionella sp.]|nr:MAG: hypothetical protein EPN84_12885 [Legionella sp.]